MRVSICTWEMIRSREWTETSYALDYRSAVDILLIAVLHWIISEKLVVEEVSYV